MMKDQEILPALQRIMESDIKKVSQLFPQFSGITIGEAVKKMDGGLDMRTLQTCNDFYSVVLAANRN